MGRLGGIDHEVTADNDLLTGTHNEGVAVTQDEKMGLFRFDVAQITRHLRLRDGALGLRNRLEMLHPLG